MKIFGDFFLWLIIKNIIKCVKFYLTKRFGNNGLLGFNVISWGISPLVTNGSSLDGRGDWDFKREAIEPSELRGT
jgi:hypothetical protein